MVRRLLTETSKPTYGLLVNHFHHRLSSEGGLRQLDLYTSTFQGLHGLIP